MDIQEMIENFEKQLEEETAKMQEQTRIVDSLGRQYAEQSSILRVIRNSIQSLNKNIAELKSLKPYPCSKNPDYYENMDEEIVSLMKVLERAVDIAIMNGIFVEAVMTKKGCTMSVRKSAINRAFNCICHTHKGPEPIMQYLAHVTDDEIKAMRDAGKKTFEVIRIARKLVRDEEDI